MSNYYYDTVLYTASVLTGLWVLFRLLRFVANRTSSSSSSSSSSPHLRLNSRPDSPSHHWAPPGRLLPCPSRCALCRRVFLIRPLLTPSPSSASLDASKGPLSSGAAGGGGGGGGVGGAMKNCAVSGALVCTDCGMSSCDRWRCLKGAEKRHRCKAIAIGTSSRRKRRSAGGGDKADKEKEVKEEWDSRLRHHWVAAAAVEECQVCDGAHITDASDGGGAMDTEEGEEELTCCWCHRTAHRSCQSRLGERCDLGEFRRFVVPPGCVTAIDEEEEEEEEEDDDDGGAAAAPAAAGRRTRTRSSRMRMAAAVRLYPRSRRR